MTTREQQSAATMVVSMAGVGLTYPGPPPVAALKPFDLNIGTGDYLAVVGPSGSGKSTLLNVLGLLDRPTAGTLHVQGFDTAQLDDDQRTALRGQQIGFVFQDYQLLPYRSALENVEIAMVYNGTPRSRRSPRATEALARVGLSHRINSMPTRLSGGERQRVAIARAVVNRPGLVLCDEPTGNLDTKTAVEVLDLLDELNGDGLTVVVITHDARVAARGRRTVSIIDGTLSESMLAPHEVGR